MELKPQDLLVLFEQVAHADRAWTYASLAEVLAVPRTWPIGLTDEFGADPTRQVLWRAFLNKNGLRSAPLPDLVVRLRDQLKAALCLAAGW